MASRPTLLNAAAALISLLPLVSGANPPARKPSNPIVPVQALDTTPGVPVDEVDVMGAWITAAREVYARVQDYQGTLVKRERINGKLQDEQTATLRVRVKPFSIHMKFVAPRSVAGREAYYTQGQNDGKMLAKAGGAIGLVGFVKLDPREPRATGGSKHNITEAGLGNLIEQLSAAHAAANAPGRQPMQVSVGETQLNGRNCVRIEAVDPNPGAAVGRVTVYFDQQTNLPVRYEAFDRQQALIESFTYVNLKFNIGLTDAEFRP